MKNKIFKTELLRSLSFCLFGMIGLGTLFVFCSQMFVIGHLLILGISFSLLIYGIFHSLYNVMAYSGYEIVKDGLSRLNTPDIIKYLDGLTAEERAAFYKFQTLNELQKFKFALEKISACPSWIIDEIVLFMQKKES